MPPIWVPAILRVIRSLARASATAGRRGRLVFSSSGDPIRATGTKVVTWGNSLRSILVSSASPVADNLFSALFPSDCRLCGNPLTSISRLPICSSCRWSIRPIAGGTCLVSGERLLRPFALSSEADEPRCGLCRRLAPPYARTVAYGGYDGALRELIHLLKYEQMQPGFSGADAGGAHGRIGLLDRARGPGCSRAARRAKTRPARVPPVRADGSICFLVRDRERPAGPVRQGAGTAARDPVANGTDAASAPGNIRGGFRVARPEAVAGREVVLVDDVHDRHHSFGMRARSAAGGSIQDVCGHGGADFEGRGNRGQTADSVRGGRAQLGGSRMSRRSSPSARYRCWVVS